MVNKEIARNTTVIFVTNGFGSSKSFEKKRRTDHLEFQVLQKILEETINFLMKIGTIEKNLPYFADTTSQFRVLIRFA